MDRREFLTAAGIMALAAWAGRAGGAFAEPTGEPPVPFSWDILKSQARELGAKPYDPDRYKTPPYAADLDYDRYRAIHFNPDKAIWRDEPLNFRMQLFHGGYIYKEPIQISIVEDGKASRIPYKRDFYEFGTAEKRVMVAENGYYSGFRLHAPIYDPTFPNFWSSRAPAISAARRRARLTACPHAASPSTPHRPPRRNSRFSAPSGSRSPRLAATWSPFMRCSIARASAARIAS
jgi:hypothetical protein